MQGNLQDYFINPTQGLGVGSIERYSLQIYNVSLKEFKAIKKNIFKPNLLP